MKLNKEQLNTFQIIYFDSYGVHINPTEAEYIIADICLLLEEIIRINYIEKDE